MNDEESGDPRWDLVIEIAAKMWVEGQYVTRLDPSPTQRLVDLQWAAHQAGRILGGRTKIHLSPPTGPQDRTVTLAATYLDPTGRQLRRAEEGLEDLLRLVLARRARG